MRVCVCIYIQHDVLCMRFLKIVIKREKNMHFMLFILILFSSHFAQIRQWSGSLWGFSFLPSSPSTLSFVFLSPGADDASDSKCSRLCFVFGLV